MFHEAQGDTPGPSSNMLGQEEKNPLMSFDIRLENVPLTRVLSKTPPIYFVFPYPLSRSHKHRDMISHRLPSTNT